MIVPVSTEAHHFAHLEPILAHLPYASSRRNRSDVALVASYGSLRRARRDGFTRFVLTQHGAGQSYGGDKRTANHPSYPGGSDNGDVGLFLVPNHHGAERWRAAYPKARVGVVGSPRLDVLPRREGKLDEPVVAISFHWDGRGIPEHRSAQATYLKALVELTKRYKVIGHGHPIRRDLTRFYRAFRVPYVPSFDDVCRQADLYVCDNSSTIFEFASTGRPVVVLNNPTYRRDVSHGLRFWDAADIGVNVDRESELLSSVALALEDRPEQQAAREAALRIVYAHRTGAAKRAAGSILEWMG